MLCFITYATVLPLKRCYLTSACYYHKALLALHWCVWQGHVPTWSCPVIRMAYDINPHLSPNYQHVPKTEPIIYLRKRVLILIWHYKSYIATSKKLYLTSSKLPSTAPCPVQLSPVQWQLLGEGLLLDNLQIWKHSKVSVNVTPEQWISLMHICSY